VIDMSIRQLLLILAARKGTVVLVLLATLASAWAVSVFLPPRYTATATVYIDLRANERLVNPVLPQDHAASYMATQMDIIRSPRVALEVVQTTGRAADPKVREDFQKDTDGAGTIEFWAAEQLLKKLEVRPSRESSVLQVSFVSPDPEDAAKIANAFANTFIATHIRLRTDPAQKSAEIFSDRSQSLRQDLDRAQRQLSEFQRKQGLVVTDEKLDSELARLDQLTRQHTEAQAQTTDARSRQNLALEVTARNTDAGALPEVLANPTIVSLKGELAKQEARMRELEARLGASHPLLEQAQAEVESNRARLRSEIRALVAGFGNALRIAETRETKLGQAVDLQKARVLEMRRARDQAALLARDIEMAQKALESSRDRQANSRLESQIPQTNASVLNPAVPPAKPTFPRLKLNLALAGVLGLLLGGGMAVARENADRRLREMEDLATIPDMPALAEIATIPLPAPHATVARLPMPADVVLHYDDRAAPSPPLLPGPTEPDAGKDAANGPLALPTLERALGAILVQDGKLTSEELERVIAAQHETGDGFLVAAGRLKLLTPDEVSDALARHFDHPRIDADRSQLSRELVTLHTPFAPELEALRALRSQLLLRWFTSAPDHRALAIVGIEEAAGKSFLVANLAVLFAQSGMRTLVVDANLRRPRQHTIFGLGSSLGLSTLLAEQTAPDALRTFPDLPNLAVLPAGLVPPNPQELIARISFVNLIERFSKTFDVILIDTPAMTSCADAQMIAARARGALFVASRGVTRAARARAVARQLAEIGAARVGILLNRHATA